MDTNNCNPQMSTAGWLPNGAKVYFTIPIALDQTEYAYEIALQFTNTLLSKGFMLTEPGLEAGEHSYTITHILRRTQPGKDNKPATPIIDFYHDSYKWSDLKTWLNTPEQITEFEAWAGVKLASMQSFPGNRVEMGANPDADSYIVKLPIPAKVVWKNNPDYTEGSKTESKRLFERFEGVNQNAQNRPPASAKSNATQATGTSIPKTSEAPEKGDIRDFSFKGFTTKQDSSGKPYYSFETVDGQFGFYAFSRDVFRAVGIPDTDSEAWKTIGTRKKFEHTVSCVYTLPEGKDTGYWTFNLPKVEKASEIEF